MTFKKITFFTALSIPFRLTPVAISLHILHSLIRMAIAPLNILVTAYFINSALLVVTEGYAASIIVLPITLIAVFAVYGYITGPLLGALGLHRTIKTRLLFRVPFLEKRARLEYTHIENRETVDLLNRVWNNPDGQINGVLDNMLNFITTIGSIISVMVILFASAPLAGIVLVVMAIPILFIASKAGKANFQATREATKDNRYAWNFDTVMINREHASERSLFGFSAWLQDKFEYHYEKDRIHRLKTNRLWFLRSKLSSIILGLLSAASLFIMAPAVANGSLSVGLFIALQGALFAAVQWIGWALPNNFQQFTFQKEFLKDVNEFLALSEVENAEALPNIIAPEFETLEFVNVSFAYPGTKKLVLQNFSLKIESGKHYAFVGVNGAGKTTLTKLITRLYDNYTGEILLNGKELRKWSLPEIKACFCVLFQEFARYDITVAENTAIGKIHGATDADIDNALELSGFDKKAKELKHGKDTLLGKTHDDGIDLSGGQWQSLAFSRAIVSPAPVKILDEPTAALDPIAESQMYAKFETISRGHTTIFISHRLASAKMADTIFVLEGGSVVEEGGHDSLMAINGLYAKMYESQQRWYLS